jgi:predicted regulator of Ras-like GTPase activity (Roadblock/LC7/MglB family)
MSDEVVLAEIRALREKLAGVTETAVAAADGLLVAAATDRAHPEVMAALAATALGLGGRAGYETGMGELCEVVIRCTGGHVVVYAVPEDALLVVVADEGLDIDLLHAEAHATIERLGTLLVSQQSSA